MRVIARALGNAFALAALSTFGCTKDRATEPAPATFRADVGPIFVRACVACHQGPSPTAGWSAASYVTAIGCVAPSGEPAVLPGDERAPILRALTAATHRGILSAEDVSAVTRWITAGTPDVRSSTHPSGIESPRSPAFHGSALRARRYAPMLDATDENACGRCHDGTSSRPDDVRFAAPGATACTTCHTEPEGVLACGTCHGDGKKRSSPPRDRCFFPTDRITHTAHVDPTSTHATGIACATCHPTPGPGVIGGTHGDGIVQVTFDPAHAGPAATYDSGDQSCAVTCHDRGGARPRPSWKETGPLGCGDCHASPPAAHFPGACANCHQEANATGTALAAGPLHLNGTVDLGDGSGGCGACHGKGSDPWPPTKPHAAHELPTLTTPLDCESCHPTPATLDAPGHLDGTVQIVFTGRALDRGAMPVWNGATCSAVACHGAQLVDPPAVEPAWNDATGAAKACGACHGLPPTQQHTASSACDRAECHGSEVERSAGVFSITPFGRSLHINGLIDHALP